MGWCSATALFDTTLDLVLKYIPEDDLLYVIENLYYMYKEGDWDCESESEYYNLLEPIIRRDHPEYWE